MANVVRNAHLKVSLPNVIYVVHGWAHATCENISRDQYKAIKSFSEIKNLSILLLYS